MYVSFDVFQGSNPYNNNIDKLSAIGLFIFALGKTIWNFLVATFTLLVDLVLQVLFGWIRTVLISSFLLALLGVVIMDNHQEVIQTSNSLKCVNAPFINDVNLLTGVLAEKSPPIICFWNFWISAGTIFIKSLLSFFWTCSDISNVLVDLIKLLAKILEAIVRFLFLDNSFLANRFDFKSIVTAVQTLLSNLRAPAVCACTDLSLFTDYIFSVIEDNNIPLTIDWYGNVLISIPQLFTQTFFNVIFGLSNVSPDVSNINNFCYGTLSAGSLVDNAVTNLILIFWPTFEPSRIGSVIAYSVCTITDGIYLFIDSTLQYIWSAAFSGPTYNVFKDADLQPVIDHTDNLGVSLVYTITPLNPCLGQSVGNAVRLVSSLIDYAKGVVQDGSNDLTLVRNSLNRFVGQSSYGGGGHILNPTGHETIQTQTSLTCLLATALNFGGLTQFDTCSTKFADFVNSLVQVLLTPLVLLTQILDNKDLLANIDGNPLKSNSRDDFEQFFAIVFDSVLDQIFAPFDYLGHLFGCIQQFTALSNVIQLVVYNLRNTARELRTLIIKLIELVIELVVLVLTVLGETVFPDSTIASEFSIFGQIFIDIFTTLLDLVLQFVKNIIDFTIGVFFPPIFGQPSVYASSHTDRSSPATLTACFGAFGDCTCGIFYAALGDICIPLTDMCIGDLFGSCGLFQTTPTWSSTQRRRTIDNPYQTPFEYLASEFPHGTCGEVFRTFADYGKDSRGNLKSYSSTLNGTLFHEKPVPSLQATSFFGCLDRLMRSFELSQNSNWTLPVDYYIQDSRLADSTVEIVRGSGMMFFDAIVDTISMFNYPEYSAGLPTPDVPEQQPIYTNTLRNEQAKTWFLKKGVNDPLALDFLSKSSALLVNGFQRSRDVFYEKSRSNSQEKMSNPYVKIADVLGRAVSTSLSIGVMFAKNTLTPEVIPHLVDGTVDTMEYIQSVKVADILSSVKQTEHLKKRDHSDQLGGIYFPEGEPDLAANDRDDLVISQAEIVAFDVKGVFTASLAVGRKWFGPYLEMLARRDMNEEQFGNTVPLRVGSPKLDRSRFAYQTKEDILSDSGFYHYGEVKKRNIFSHIYALNLSLPDTLQVNEIQNYHPDVSYLYGMGGMVNFENHIPFSCVRIHGYCDAPASDPTVLDNCGDDFYFQTLGLCSDFFGYGIVSQCGEDFQAFAVYATNACEGAPLKLAVATAANPVRCIRFSINPPGPVNDYFCVEYNQCSSCPIKKVIPNLECAALDKLFHEEEFPLERCWALLVGPIYPPFNFTSSLPTATDPIIIDPTGGYIPVPTPTPASLSTCTSVCGDRIKSDEVDQNGRLCEECEDSNTRAGDGCSSSCKREYCPRFRLPAFPVAPGQETPLTCSSGTFDSKQSRRTSRYCWARSIVQMPYDGKSHSSDLKLDSLQFGCSGRYPVVTEYELPDCNGYSVARTFSKNCTQEGTVDLAYYQIGDPTILVPALSVHLGADVTCKAKCNLCGDGIVQSPEQCDSNPYSNPACTYCLKTTAVCNSPSTQFCQGVCIPNLGEIPVDSRYGVQVPSFCQSLLNINPVNCPFGYTCRYFSVVNVLKREMTDFGNLTLTEELLRKASELLHEEIEEKRKRDYEEAYKAEVERRRNDPRSHYVDPLVVVNDTLFTPQVNPVKDDFIHVFASNQVNAVTKLFTGSTSASYITSFIDWFKRPGYGTDTPPGERGAKFELTFQLFCDVVKSFDGTLGEGLIRGTTIWLGILAAVIVFGGLAGSVISNFSMTVFAMIAFALWLRLTFGTALVGCYITSTPPRIRIPETVFVELNNVAALINGTCIDFLQPMATSPCIPIACNQTFLNCASLNYVDGFDSFFGLMETWLPVEIPQWFRSSGVVADAEKALRFISWKSGYDLWGSYSIAKDNFNFNGVLPHPAHKHCSIITSLSNAEIPLILLVAIYSVSRFIRIYSQLLFDVGYLSYATANLMNHLFIIPRQSLVRDYQLMRRIKQAKEKEKANIKLE